MCVCVGGQGVCVCRGAGVCVCVCVGGQGVCVCRGAGGVCVGGWQNNVGSAWGLGAGGWGRGAVSLAVLFHGVSTSESHDFKGRD